MTVLLKSECFAMKRQKWQRPKGGSKNVFTIYLFGLKNSVKELDTFNRIMDQYDNTPKPGNSSQRTFYKKAEAERAWVHLMMVW